MHPGEILRDDYMEPQGIPPKKLAALTQWSEESITDIIDEQKGIPIGLCEKLDEVLQTEPGYWLKLQEAYDDRVAELNP